MEGHIEIKAEVTSFESIINELKEQKAKMESLDDPTAEDNWRIILGDAVFSVDEAIELLERL